MAHTDMTNEERIDHLTDRIEELIKRVDLMASGDKQIGMKGYTARIGDNEETIIEHERRMNKIDRRFDKIYQRVIGICIGVSIAASAVGFAIDHSVSDAKANIPSVKQMYVPPLAAPIYPNINQIKKDTVK